MPSIENLLRKISAELAPASGSSATQEAFIILETLLGLSYTELHAESQRPVEPAIVDKCNAIVGCRLSGEPLAYILGKVYFYSQYFTVTPDVLIPRPETEILVDIVLKTYKQACGMFLDIGTGSGIIAQCITNEKPGWRCMAVDKSLPALSVATRNRTGNRVALFGADIVSALKGLRQFDFIVSNPPYISRTEIQTLDRDVKDFEPHSALDGGIDGLDFYRIFASSLKPFIKPGGFLFCEIGFGQAEAIKEIFLRNNWGTFEIFNDFADIPRVIKVSPE
ncbi:MAG: peptide chain release factor N(5)-glutamine methyltransferase [Chitinivibrionales bacterium]|nr:peptide chain release factor N(5)-glutamine methyltransferase [Chitinivibrionales bacterium]